MAVLILFTLVALIAPGWTATTGFMAMYQARRERLIEREDSLMFGGDHTHMTADEQTVDEMLRADRRQIVENARLHGADFPAARNFLVSRPDMETTEAFKIIRRMPKGGALHVHKTAMSHLGWLIKNVTYRPDLYMCVKPNNYVEFRFADTTPTSDDCTWDLVSNFRNEYADPAEFDQTLYNNLSLVTPDPAEAYPDLNSVWDAFEGFFGSVGGLVYHAPVWWDYVWQSLTEFLEDNVQYVEIRGGLPKLYELNGTTHEREWSIENVYIPLFRQFGEQNPDFIGAKLIMTKFRGASPEKVAGYVQEALQMHNQYPDLIVGFDLVGQEDPNGPLKTFVEGLSRPLLNHEDLPYYFHAGETVWEGTATDENLVDAYMLGARRIGHGYALVKHPLLMKLYKKREIAIEVNPISNQVLMLVEDLRNHPAATLLAEDMPVVISSDDPAVWDALPLSHDFYVTFMAMMGDDMGVPALRKLAVNSIKYSAMTPSEKQVALRKLSSRWNTFMAETAHQLQSQQTNVPAA